MSDNSTSPLSWIIPSVLSAVVGLAAIWQGYQVAAVSQETQKSLEISKVKLEIVSSAKKYDRQSSEILFEHVLKPIDADDSYKKFRNDFLSLNSELAPASPAPAKQTQIVSQATVNNSGSKSNAKEFTSLVAQFPSDTRLVASDKLVLAYKESPEGVVSALVNGLLPEHNKFSYRVNLYIAFTLARIQPNWTGNNQQIHAIQDLKKSSNYKKDSTFRRRVDEAIENQSESSNA